MHHLFNGLHPIKIKSRVTLSYAAFLRLSPVPVSQRFRCDNLTAVIAACISDNDSQIDTSPECRPNSAEAWTRRRFEVKPQRLEQRNCRDLPKKVQPRLILRHLLPVQPPYLQYHLSVDGEGGGGLAQRGQKYTGNWSLSLACPQRNIYSPQTKKINQISLQPRPLVRPGGRASSRYEGSAAGNGPTAQSLLFTGLSISWTG